MTPLLVTANRQYKIHEAGLITGRETWGARDA